MNNRCLYCEKERKTYPVKSWNKDEIKYYCSEHVGQVQANQRNGALAFYKHYEHEETRKWLSDKGLKLWEELDKKYKETK